MGSAVIISPDDLLAEGFRELKIPNGSTMHKGADRFFQTCIRSPQDLKLYHINAYFYDWSAYDKPGPKTSVMFEVWAYAGGDRADHFTVCYSPEGKTLAKAMAFMATAWGSLSGVPYEREEAHDLS
jgi:hypothetical protein